MHIHIVSIFPSIFTSFLETSLIEKAQEKNLVTFKLYNPRDFCTDTHQQIDDTVYGGGAWMLLKAQPIIDSIESILSTIDSEDFLIVFPWPAQEVFGQMHAHSWAKYEHIIFVCWRYEGIDYRWEQYFQDKYPNKFIKTSLGSFVTLGGEVPTMVMIEAITRLVPGVIKERDSWVDESYSIAKNMTNIEHPQYTKPAEVYGYTVPDILVSGDQKKIHDRKKQSSSSSNIQSWEQ